MRARGGRRGAAPPRPGRGRRRAARLARGGRQQAHDARVRGQAQHSNRVRARQRQRQQRNQLLLCARAVRRAAAVLQRLPRARAPPLTFARAR